MTRSAFRRETKVVVRAAALQRNWAALRSLLPARTGVLAVVKANAYGHGIVDVSREFVRLGAAALGVADISEGLILREAGVEGNVICLGTISPDALPVAAEHDLIVALHSEELLEAFEKTAKRSGKWLRAHVKLETGMNRLGIEEDAWPRIADRLARAPFSVEGIFTHLAESDNPDKVFTERQLRTFSRGAEAFEKALGRRLIRHAGNSGAVLNHPDSHLDWVRAGLALYGYPNPAPPQRPFETALEWTAPVIQVKAITPGDTVGYGRAFHAERAMRIGTVAVGYGDGFHRGYAGAPLGFRGSRVPILGAVCMDQLIVDLSRFPDARAGEAVMLLSDGHNGPDARELARAMGTVAYEVLTGIGIRVAREWKPA